jgi:hypothetical protein
MTLRRFALLLALPAAAALACSHAAAPPPSTSTYPASTTSNAARQNAYRAAADALAHDVNAPRDSIAGVSQDEITWRDSCLGCAKTGESCTQVLTPGYRVVLRVSEATYEYHTNLGGTARLCNQSPAPPAGYAAVPASPYAAPPPAPTPYH